MTRPGPPIDDAPDTGARPPGPPVSADPELVPLDADAGGANRPRSPQGRNASVVDMDFVVLRPVDGGHSRHVPPERAALAWPQPVLAGVAHALQGSPAVASAVRRYLTVSVLVLLAVGLPTAGALSTVAHELATAAAIERTDRFADRVVGPMLDPGPDGVPTEVGSRALDRVVAARVADGSMHGVRVWDHLGRLLYTAGEVGAAGVTTDQPSLDAAREGDAVLEGTEQVRVLVASDTHVVDPFVVEVLVPRSEVLQVQQQLRWPFVLAAMLGLLVLTAAQLPLAVSMAHRVQEAERSRRLLLAQAVASCELERRRLAQQLHDDVIQDLAGLGYALESLALHLPLEERGPVVAARELVQTDLGKLRDILADVYPSQVDHCQLQDGLAAWARALRDGGTDVVLDVDIAAPLDVERATLLHRVAREALANIDKHADACRVRVSVRHGRLGTEMRIRDDGRGFDPARSESRGHVGLRLVHDLVHELGGSLRVSSEPDSGTVVSLRLPPA